MSTQEPILLASQPSTIKWKLDYNLRIRVNTQLDIIVFQHIPLQQFALLLQKSENLLRSLDPCLSVTFGINVKFFMSIDMLIFNISLKERD
jgi:hypothetical protein